MECNRDEALRAVDIAERKIAMQDYTSAKKLLLKAQQLYPSLDKVSRMLAVVEVHTIAQAKAPGTEIDCYQLLQVDTTADDSIIKKNYRRLALLLHPDKNKSPGAEAAFKLIGEAWAVLSDKTKRTFYDAKRALAGNNCKVTKAPTKKQGQNGHSNLPQTQVPNATANYQPNNHAGSFWTACPHCKMQYEYYKTYLNFNLKCNKCLNVFVARDIHDASVNGMNTSFGYPNSHASVGTQQPQGFMFYPGLHNSFGGSSFPGSGATRVATGIPSAGTGRDTINKVHCSQGGVKSAQKVFEEIKRDPAAVRHRVAKQDLDRVNQKGKEEEENLNENLKKQQAIDDLVMKRKKKDEEAVARRKVQDSRSRKRLKKATPRDEDEYEHEEEYEEEVKKLNRLVSDSQEGPHDAAMECEIRRSSRKRNNIDYNFDGSDDDDLVAFPRSRRRGKADVRATAELQNCDTVPIEVHRSPERQLDEQDDSDDEPFSDDEPDSDDEQHGIPVPDPDFYVFDQDRLEKCFSVGQIWAVYDDLDGMPRFYCRIIKVISSDRFGVSMKWLEALPAFNETPGRIAGLSVACGEFKHTKRQHTENNISLFSHVMKVDMAHKNVVKIYPRKGEIWALFRDWDLEEFRILTADQAKSWKFEIVEVSTDFSEETGVHVVSLVKVVGYKTVFARNVKGCSPVGKWFPSNELLRFSHMVPSWKIVGKEPVSVLNGSWDLDPASLPLELIHEPAHQNVDR
ncbi:hypothetical protein O6H91_02G106800 [Diphasiastrum complanatum]|uniref:Uncharacterized protein n=1 Tax=Diphasiastrum complanatum TaxID=34168 RepID=A0ACC2EJ58_DIPCM|nr:hypothetical protein O6H91_02G106800 [Diphasiastrum complanatum]